VIVREIELDEIDALGQKIEVIVEKIVAC